MTPFHSFLPSTGPPIQIFTWEAIFWPFDSFLWLATVISLFIATIGTLTMTHYETGIPNWSIGSSFEFYCRSFLDQGDGRLSQTKWALKLFIAFWSLAILVLNTAYKSKMVSFMTFPVLSEIPQTFDALANSRFRIDYHYFGNVAYTLFKTSKPGSTFGIIYEKMYREPDAIKGLTRTVHEQSAFITFITTWDELKYRNFSDRRGISPMKFHFYRGLMYPAGVVLEHKSKFEEGFRLTVNTAREMGLMWFWEMEDFHKILK
jgi:hypothetical protein